MGSSLLGGGGHRPPVLPPWIRHWREGEGEREGERLTATASSSTGRQREDRPCLYTETQCTTVTQKQGQCLPLDMHPDFMSVTDLSYGSHVFHMSTERSASIGDYHYWCATTGNVLLHCEIQCNRVLDSKQLLQI
jgi:hypothetical protein